jgi:hypothetical protein
VPLTIDTFTSESQVFAKWYRTVPRIVVASNSNLALANTDEGYISVTGTVAGQIITLGLGTSYNPGHEICIHNGSTQSLLVRTFDAAQLVVLAAGERAYILARETVTTAGLWDVTVSDRRVSSSTSLAVVQKRRTTSFTLPAAFADVTLDTTDVQNNTAILAIDGGNAARIQVLIAGVYQIGYACTIDNGINYSNQFLRCMLNGSQILAGSERVQYDSGEKQNFCNVFTTTLSAGDYISLQGQTDGVQITDPKLILANLVFWIVELKGSKGDQGLPGSGSSITVKNDNTNIANTPHTALNFAPPLRATDAGGGTALIENLFGQYFTEAAVEAGTTTTLATYQLSVRLTTPNVPAGKYRVGWSYEWGLSTTSNNFNGRILQDGATVLWDHVQEPQDNAAAQQHPAGGFQYVTLTAGVHTFDIEYRSQTAGVTARIWDSHLEFWRVPT